jgi:hypothetical protein
MTNEIYPTYCISLLALSFRSIGIEEWKDVILIFDVHASVPKRKNIILYLEMFLSFHQKNSVGLFSLWNFSTNIPIFSLVPEMLLNIN